MNDSVALHDGNVGLDNLQLQTTTTTNKQANNMVVKMSAQDKLDGTKTRQKKQNKKSEREEQEENETEVSTLLIG